MDISELTQKILARRPSPADPVKIVQAGHPALRRRGQDVLTVPVDGGVVGEELPASVCRLAPELLIDLAEAMTITMRKAPGVGLAAPQIGLPLRMAVLEDPFAAEPGQDEDDDLHERTPLDLRCLLDPVYDMPGDQTVFAFEGCLSVDGWQSIVPRSRRVRVRAVELCADGVLRRIDEELVGWPARIVQHETDHLDGVLCHDRSVPRSFVHNAYAARYTVAEAAHRLGLQGDVTRLAPDRITLDTATGDIRHAC